MKNETKEINENTIQTKSGRTYITDISDVFIGKDSAIYLAQERTQKDNDFNYRLPTKEEFLEDFSELNLSMHGSEHKFHESYDGYTWEHHEETIYFINQFKNNNNLLGMFFSEKENKWNEYKGYMNSISAMFVFIKEKNTEIFTESHLLFSVEVFKNDSSTEFDNIGLSDMIAKSGKFKIPGKLLFTESDIVLSCLQSNSDEYSLKIFLKEDLTVFIYYRFSSDEKLYNKEVFDKKLDKVKILYEDIFNLKNNEVY